MRKISSDKGFKFPFLPNKKLGQNFLLDENILKKIISNLPVEENTIIIEIGSGYGHLTKFLAKTNCQKVVSYEKDRQLFVGLQDEGFKNNISLQSKTFFLNEDALKIDGKKTLLEHGNQRALFLIVGNLPYSISNLMLCNLLKNANLFESFFLVQKEVAQRWVATPQKYKKEYSSLSVYIDVLASCEILFDISKKNFFPQPLVDGTLIHLKMKKLSPIEKKNQATFFSFLKNCFRYRRKTLGNNLLIASLKEKSIEKIFIQLNYDEKIRPQQLTAQEYVILYKECVKNGHSF